MKVHCFHIALAIWLAAIVPMGFADTFPNRPTQAEMDEIVTMGTECIRGVNERCLATQFQTNPVEYCVAPFTNTAGWYLDQSLMGTMASKIRSLVTNYVDQDTVKVGTTNIAMLTVPGLWASLEIGDHIDQFTSTPAIGTNPPTYGDDPCRIYVEDLQERYKVLNAMAVTAASLNMTTNANYKIIGGSGATWEAAKAAAEAAFLASEWQYHDVAPDAYTRRGSATQAEIFGSIGVYYSEIPTNIPRKSIEFWMKVNNPSARYGDPGTFDANGDNVSTNYTMPITISNITLARIEFSVEPSSALPNWCDNVPGATRGYISSYSGNRWLLVDWQFQYATDKFWEP